MNEWMNEWGQYLPDYTAQVPEESPVNNIRRSEKLKSDAQQVLHITPRQHAQ
jgi:hypothetical protein